VTAIVKEELNLCPQQVSHQEQDKVSWCGVFVYSAVSELLRALHPSNANRFVYGREKHRVRRNKWEES